MGNLPSRIHRGRGQHWKFSYEDPELKKELHKRDGLELKEPTWFFQGDLEGELLRLKIQEEEKKEI